MTGVYLKFNTLLSKYIYSHWCDTIFLCNFNWVDFRLRSFNSTMVYGDLSTFIFLTWVKSWIPIFNYKPNNWSILFIFNAILRWRIFLICAYSNILLEFRMNQKKCLCIMYDIETYTSEIIIFSIKFTLLCALQFVYH